jgi:hypothetical protein
MGSTANDSGRSVTVSGTIATAGFVSPGSHASNDEWTAGLRFTSVTVPQGTSITSATLTLTPQATWCPGGITIRYHVSTQAADNAGALSGTSGDLNTTARPRSTADAGPWTQSCVTVDVAQTLDVTNIVQEIINRAGWTSGNAIVILIDTHADTTLGEWQDYHSFDDSAANAPKLDIVYSTGGGGSAIVKVRGKVNIRGKVKFR